MGTKLTVAALEKIGKSSERREIADAGSDGLRLIVQPSGAKSWAMRFRRPDGKPAKLTLGPVDLSSGAATEPVIGGPLTLVQARALAAEINRQRAAGRDVVLDQKEDRRRRRVETGERASNSFGSIARDFIEGHKVKKTGQRPRGWREIARLLGLDYPAAGGEPTCIKDGLAERWADRPIGDVDGHDIHAVVTEAVKYGVPGMQARNDGASDNRGRKMADALGSLFKWAVRHRRKALRTNPVLGVYRPGPPAARDRVLTNTEVRWLWAACDDVGQPFGPICKLLLLTGCRLNEVARLEWSELSEDFSVVTLPGQRTKNALSHIVTLPPMARDIVKGVRRIEECRYVFSTKGKTPVSGWSKVKQRIDEHMGAEAKKQNVTLAPWRLHDLRRTAATGMAEIGIAPHVVEACLNHVSGAKAGVAGTYNRAAYAAEKKVALERWTAHVTGIVSDKAANVIALRGRSP